MSGSAVDEKMCTLRSFLDDCSRNSYQANEATCLLRAIENGESGTFSLDRYRENGEPFFNITPLSGGVLSNRFTSVAEGRIQRRSTGFGLFRGFECGYCLCVSTYPLLDGIREVTYAHYKDDRFFV